MSSQADFAHALLNPDAPCPSGLTSWNGSDPATRFAVYRNNVMVSLIDALASSFPVAQTLVGEEFFRAMAADFARTHPPRSAVMTWYGQDFADFVAAFSPAASVPYLADVARLEWAQLQAYHAADATPLSAETLQATLQDPQQLTQLRWSLHPSVRVLSSAYAVLGIWAAHQGEQPPTHIEPDGPQTVLVFRDGLDVQTVDVSAGCGRFIDGLQNGQTLLTAAQMTIDSHAKFDLPQALATLLHWQLVTATTHGDPHHAIPQ